MTEDPVTARETTNAGGRRPADRRTKGEGRGGLRREMIVAAAAELFRKKGYRGTSLDDIGAAVGTTGPAIYRHFASKEAVLIELVERAVQRSQRDVVAALNLGLAPLPTLMEIVRRAVDHVIEEADLVAMADQEGRSLSAASQQRVARDRRAVVAAWRAAVRAVRPELSDDQLQSVCRAAFALTLP